MYGSVGPGLVSFPGQFVSSSLGSRTSRADRHMSETQKVQFSEGARSGVMRIANLKKLNLTCLAYKSLLFSKSPNQLTYFIKRNLFLIKCDLGMTP